MIAAGITNKAIAYKLAISIHTVEYHVGNILQKRNIESRTAAVLRGHELGIAWQPSNFTLTKATLLKRSVAFLCYITQTRVEGGTTNNYTYDTNHKHAVAQAGTGKYFCYDANGNMTKRNATNSTCTSGGDSMSSDVENRMTSMTTASGTTSFAYNGDGARVSRTIATGTTYYVGNYYEVWKPAGSATFNKYYFFGANRLATRINGTLFYMQGDYLGSSSLLMTTAGALQTRQAYFPYGDKRLADGSALPTGMDTTFTGQKSDDSTGLMYYGARYYDTTLGRFTQADTIIPSPMNPQSLNRYSYVSNNPVRYTDPTGHMEADEGTGGNGTEGDDPIETQSEVVSQNEDGEIVIAATPENQYPNGKACWPHCNDDELRRIAASVAYGVGIGFDAVSLLVDDTAFILTMFDAFAGGAVLGVATAEVAGVGAVPGFVSGYILGDLETTPVRLIGTGLSFGGTLATGIGDFLADESHIGVTKSPAGMPQITVDLGANTRNSLMTFIPGAVIPDSTISAILANEQFFGNDLHLFPTTLEIADGIGIGSWFGGP